MTSSRVHGTRRVVLAVTMLATLMVTTVGAASATSGRPGDAFVKRDGSDLTLNHRPFTFVGTNNYYLMYSSPFMVDDVLNGAAANGFTVMRTWGWLDQTPKNGIVFQTFDGTSMTYNDGPTGLGNLDYTVAKAGALGLKLVIPFTGNWGDFGGEDQYVTWAGGAFHDDFYTNAKAKTLYKAWISHLLNHVNSITGVAYKNDPTIMTWELANEPRCVGSGTYPASPSCNTNTITGWAAEMSAYIKSLDRKHLVSSGSEGFLCIAGATEYERDCASGVDELAISKLPTIDVVSYHLYPDGGWNKTIDWGTTWIKDHVKLAKKVHKASMLGEFGLKDLAARNVTYKTWTDTVRRAGGTGALFWILTGKNDDGSLYGNFDGFRVNCPSPTCTVLANAAIGTKDHHRFDRLPPVADNLSATVDFGGTWTSWPAASAVAYGHWNHIVAGSIDLDPATAGRQTSIAVTGGSFAVQVDGSVLFTPTSGYHGPASTSYTIKDQRHRTSNVATLSVTVKPDPSAAIKIVSFETGTDGWGPAGGAGTVTQSSAFATDGTSSLEINVTGEGWFGGTLAAPVDLTGKTLVKLDLQTLAAQTFTKLSIQVGSGFDWCEQSGGGGNQVQNSVGVVSIDLTNLTCSSPDLTKLQAVNIYLQPGTYRIDNIRAE